MNVLEGLLEKAKKVAEQAEVFHVSQKETPVIFEANRLKLLQSREAERIILRLVKDGRVGVSSTNNINDQDGLLQRALEVAPYGAEARFTLPGRMEYPSVDGYDPAVEKVTIEEMVQLGQSMIDRVRREHDGLQCEARVTRAVATISIMNSNGCAVSYVKSVCAMALEGNRVREDDMLFVGDHEVSPHPILDHRRLTDTVLQQLEYARETAPAPPGPVPVVFSHDAVAQVFVPSLAIAFNGKTVLQGASPLVDKLGHKIFDQGLTLWDDPLYPDCAGNRICDDEGMPSQRIMLVDHGVPKQFLYDLQTAGLARARSTGSADRGMGSVPSPALGVLIVEPGGTPYQDMLADIPDGLMVEGLLGAGQTNVVGGDFSGNVLLGYKIEKGRIVGRVKNTVVAGNMYHVLKQGLALSRERKWVGGALLTPAFCCQGVSVSTKG
ncbi:MAG: metallopeptidase TldD-related protein [Chloroflexota bacterium]